MINWRLCGYFGRWSGEVLLLSIVQREISTSDNVLSAIGRWPKSTSTCRCLHCLDLAYIIWIYSSIMEVTIWANILELLNNDGDGWVSELITMLVFVQCDIVSLSISLKGIHPFIFMAHNTTFHNSCVTTWTYVLWHLTITQCKNSNLLTYEVIPKKQRSLHSTNLLKCVLIVYYPLLHLPHYWPSCGVSVYDFSF